MNSLVAFAAAVALTGVTAPSPAAEYIQYRGGCPNSFRKFIESQTTKAYTKITFFGGSASEGLGASKADICFRSLVMRNLRQQFPGATLAENNSAIGGSGVPHADRCALRRRGPGPGRIRRRCARGQRGRGIGGRRRDRASDHRPGSDHRHRLPLCSGPRPVGCVSTRPAARPRRLARTHRRALRHSERQPGPIRRPKDRGRRVDCRCRVQGRPADDRPRPRPLHRRDPRWNAPGACLTIGPGSTPAGSSAGRAPSSGSCTSSSATSPARC